jgi:hypothetical protein
VRLPVLALLVGIPRRSLHARDHSHGRFTGASLGNPQVSRG